MGLALGRCPWLSLPCFFIGSLYFVFSWTNSNPFPPTFTAHFPKTTKKFHPPKDMLKKRKNTGRFNHELCFPGCFGGMFPWKPPTEFSRLVKKHLFHEDSPWGLLASSKVYLYQAAILCRDDGLSGGGEF